MHGPNLLALTHARHARGRRAAGGRLARRLSALCAVATAAVAAICVVAPGILRDPPMTVGNARGTALTLLALGIPLLVAGLIAAARGSARGLIVWLAALGYVLYNAVLFCFAVRFNPLFLGFVAMFGLALWSLVAAVREVDAAAVRARFVAPRVPARIAAGYLAACAALFAALWLRDLVPATLAGEPPASLAGTAFLTNPVHVLDLAITLPLMLVAAIGLLRDRAPAYVLGPALIVMLAVETAGVAVDQVFGHLHDPAAPLAAVPMLIGLTVVGVAIAVMLLGRIGPVRAAR
jgi:hypothetical protein